MSQQLLTVRSLLSVAIKAADIVPIHTDLLNIAAALDHSPAIFGTIRCNIAWAGMYNVFRIPLFMGVLR